jgi:hypothetical protein
MSATPIDEPEDFSAEVDEAEDVGDLDLEMDLAVEDDPGCDGIVVHRPENPRQRDAFERYFRQGVSRSIERLHDELAAAGEKRSLRTLYNWSSWYRWQQRVAELELDAFLAEEERLVSDLRSAQSRKGQIGRAMQRTALSRLEGLSAELKPADVLRFLQLGVQLEEEALAEAIARAQRESGLRTRQLQHLAFKSGFESDEQDLRRFDRLDRLG